LARQHTRPVYFSETGSMQGHLADPLSLPEADLQELVHNHPDALPIPEIDPAFSGVDLDMPRNEHAGRSDR